MKTAMIAGATGLVGSHLLDQLLNNEHYSKIIVISRRKLSFEHPKMEIVELSFDNLDQLKIVEPIDECYCALGTTQAKSGKEGLRKVDLEYVVELAKMCKRMDVPKLLIVSSLGADRNSSFFYMKTKGLMEKLVKEVGLKTLIVVRPSLITGKRAEFRFAEKMGGLFYFIFTPFMVGPLKKYRPVSGLQIAKTLIGLAQTNLVGTYFFDSDFIYDYR
jgi:uncharacterized protein YbjT (DUF2867 family)